MGQRGGGGGDDKSVMVIPKLTVKVWIAISIYSNFCSQDPIFASKYLTTLVENRT